MKNMPLICDNKSVGIIFKNSEGKYLLILRRTDPKFYACPASHVDVHGGSVDTAKEEVQKEAGASGVPLNLVLQKDYPNPCSRGGIHHLWSVFEGEYDGPISDSEAGSVSWKTLKEIKELAARTKSHIAEKISQEDWENKPGLEQVWIDIFKELNIL
ncbi:MAG: NUDIX domain-containing protein [Patescibacteria group bacterium]|nr:NUDIX domain-containing protein [Patescibacteria group bacterium]